MAASAHVSVLRIATRGSPLALAQAREVARRLRNAHPSLSPATAIDIIAIRTTGDRLKGPLAEAGGKGLFTKEIEEALAQNRADIAVHSMKDMPTALPAGLIVGALLPREDPRDALIARGALSSLADLPAGTVVGTSSLRRSAILRMRRPDLAVAPLRGNVETRLKRVHEGAIGATILAIAGLKRLGIGHRASAILDPDEMLPSVCQGAIGIECRADDAATLALLAAVDHAATALCVAAERAFLAALDGSCRTPIAGLATLDRTDLHLRGLIVRPDGSESLAVERRGDAADATALGRDAGEELRRRAPDGFFADGA